MFCKSQFNHVAKLFFLGTNFKLGCMFHKITFLMDCNMDCTSKFSILTSHVSDATLALWRDKLNQFRAEKKANNRWAYFIWQWQISVIKVSSWFISNSSWQLFVLFQILDNLKLYIERSSIGMSTGIGRGDSCIPLASSLVYTFNMFVNICVCI
jgi:hypothetical protein